MARFKTLEVTNWRQFRSVNVEFHPQATVIVGVNGSGKTSLLNILSQPIGWAPEFIGTPTVDEETGEVRYLSGLMEEETDEGKRVVACGPDVNRIGSLTYNIGCKTNLYAPPEGSTFNIDLASHRANAWHLHYFAPTRLLLSGRQSDSHEGSSRRSATQPVPGQPA